MSWRNDYLAALQARDQREQANKPVFDACTWPAVLCHSLRLTILQTQSSQTNMLNWPSQRP